MPSSGTGRQTGWCGRPLDVRRGAFPVPLKLFGLESEVLVIHIARAICLMQHIAAFRYLTVLLARLLPVYYRLGLLLLMVQLGRWLAMLAKRRGSTSSPPLAQLVQIKTHCAVGDYADLRANHLRSH